MAHLRRKVAYRRRSMAVPCGNGGRTARCERGGAAHRVGRWRLEARSQVLSQRRTSGLQTTPSAFRSPLFGRTTRWRAKGDIGWLQCGRGGAIVVKKTDTGETVGTLAGHSNIVEALLVLADGRLASASSDKTLKVWE